MQKAPSGKFIYIRAPYGEGVGMHPSQSGQSPVAGGIVDGQNVRLYAPHKGAHGPHGAQIPQLLEI